MKCYFNSLDAPKPTRPLRPGTTAVIHWDGLVLLHRRSDNPLWTLPGGVMELGESAAQCCAREVKEEVGLDVKVERLLGLYTSPHLIFDYGDGEVYQSFVMAFRCRALSSELILNEETSEARWFTVSEIGKLDLFPLVNDVIMRSCTAERTYFD